MNAAIPSTSDYDNIVGVGYWQWAAQYFTKAALPPFDSVTQYSDTVVGYPEIAYWKTAYFMQTVNTANQ